MNEVYKIEQKIRDAGLLQFRGYNEFLIKSLIDNSIIFGSAKNFNDPYDCNLPIHTECSRYEIQNLLLEISASRKSFDLDFISKRIEELFLNPTGFRNQIKDLIYDHRRFSCFTIGSNEKHLSNSKFWANYANKHKGICLKFSGELLKHYYEIYKGKISLIPIKYCRHDEIPKFNYIKNRISREALASQYFFGTKSNEWQDEEEVRLIYVSQERIKYHYVNFPFEPKCLEKVYLGCKLDKSEMDHILNIFNNSKYNHVDIYQLELNNNKFKLDPIIIKEGQNIHS